MLIKGFDENRLTHDPEMYRYYQSVSENLEDQQVGGPSLQWLFQTLVETRRLSKVGSPDVPCLTFCGAEDSIVAIPAVRKRMGKWHKGQLDLVPNARHDVLYETSDIRDRVFGAIATHFGKHGS